MLDVKLQLEDLEDIERIYSDFETELEFTINTLEEAIEYMEEELSGKYKDKFIELFQEQINQISEYRESTSELHKFVSDVIEDINDTVSVENKQIYFKYDEKQFKKLVDNAEEQLDSNSYDYKRMVEMSYGFEEWYKSQQNKISIHIDSNQRLISQTASSIEEGLRLHDDKKVLNHNYNVIKKLDNALQNIKFDAEIEELQNVQRNLNKLSLLNEYNNLMPFSGFNVVNTAIHSELAVSFVKKRNNDFSFEDFADLYASLAINYDGKRFKMTADVYGVKNALIRLQELGYTRDQAIIAFSIVNMQHISVASYEDYTKYLYNQLNSMYSSEEVEIVKSYYLENEKNLKELYVKISQTKDIDFAHMMLAVSVQLDNKPKGLILEIGLNGYRDEYYAWKGDVESGRMDKDDIKADINAFVIANIYSENSRFNSEDAINYINAVNDGTLNPTDEFLKIYGNGDIEKGYNEIIKQLNDTTSGTVVINEGMKKGAISELYDALPFKFLKFENYFSDNEAVKNSYNEFTDYMKTTSSVNDLSSRQELYD